MLVSIISFNAVSSNTVFPIGLPIVTTPEIPEFSYIAAIGLILFLSFKEVFSVSKLQGKALESSLNMVIVPLLISFITISIYKIAEVCM